MNTIILKMKIVTIACNHFVIADPAAYFLANFEDKTVSKNMKPASETYQLYTIVSLRCITFSSFTEW